MCSNIKTGIYTDFEYTYIVHEVFFVNQKLENLREVLNLYRTGKFNPLTPNVNYSGHTAPLTSKIAFYVFIQQI